MTRLLTRLLLAAGAGLILGGCPSTSGPSAFLTLAEQFGAESLQGTDDDAGSGGGSGDAADLLFRRTMTVTLANNADADLEVSLAAWVLPSSIREQSQEDALIEDGYVQVATELRIGTLRIPPGSFVLDGNGFAGAEQITILAAGEGAATENTREILTPDVLLIFNEPPISCESTAFEFSRGGAPITSTIFRNDSTIGATNAGGRKSYAQIDAYQCSPFKPGLYFRPGGGARSSNEFFEGESVRVDFIRVVTDNGAAAFVTFE